MTKKELVLEKIQSNKGNLWLKSHTNTGTINTEGLRLTTMDNIVVAALNSMTEKNVLEDDIEISAVLQSFCC